MCLEQTWSLLYITVLIERHSISIRIFLDLISSAFFRHKKGKSGCTVPPPRKKRKTEARQGGGLQRQITTSRAEDTHRVATETERAEDDKSDDDADDVRVVRVLFLRVEIKTENRNVVLFLPRDQIFRRSNARRLRR